MHHVEKVTHLLASYISRYEKRIRDLAVYINVYELNVKRSDNI